MTNPEQPARALSFEPDLAEQCALKMGWTYEPRFEGDVTGYWRYGPGPNDRYIDEELPAFDEDETAAFQLVNYIRQNISKYVFIDAYDDYFLVQVRTVEHGHYILATGKANTAPEAICLAFLALDL